MSYPEPRYRGEKGEISANFRPATQKPELTIGSGTAVRYLATGASTMDNSACIGGMRNRTRRGLPRTSTKTCPNRSSFSLVTSGYSTANAGSTQRQEIFCLFRKAACMASRMTPTKRRPC